MPGLRLTIKYNICYGSVFEKTEERLAKNSKYQEAIKFIGKNKNIDRYRDMIDFLFCEIFTQWRNDCFKFYDGKGPMLKDHPDITKKMISDYDYFLSCIVLPMATTIHRVKRKQPWCQFSSALNSMSKIIFEQIETCEGELNVNKLLDNL